MLFSLHAFVRWRAQSVGNHAVIRDATEGYWIMKDMVEMYKALRQLKKDEAGVTMVEYGLMAALIAVVCIGAVTLLGTTLSAKFTAVQAAVAAA